MKWLTKLRRIVATYERDISTIAQHVQGVENEMRNAMHFIKKATKVHFDVGIEAQSTVIVVGQYKGRDHVQVFNVEPKDFEALVRQMREVQGHATIGRIDAPPGAISTTIKRELKQ